MAKKRTWVHIVLLATLIISTVSLAAGLGTPLKNLDTPALDVEKITFDHITIKFLPDSKRTGTLEAELYDLNNHLLAKITQHHEGKPFKVSLYTPIDKNHPENYYLRYRLDSSQPYQQRSLLFLSAVLDVTVLGQREFVAGTTPIIRVLVTDRTTGLVISNAGVSIELRQDKHLIAKARTTTNDKGESSVPLQLPDTVLQNGRMKITVKTSVAKQRIIEQSIRIRSSLKTLLTTDKPMYQPGQTIHIRALSLNQSDKKPITDAEVIFEVEDAKGNKVFKEKHTTDAFGISDADFVLANELNKGTYRIRAIVAGIREEKTVTVERYVLPKFKSNVTMDRSFYQPGETVKGDLQVDYFFGKPVSGGKVEIHCSKFDVAYQDFQVIEGKTDDQGHYHFEVTLPDHFVGQPFEAGKASAKFDIKVTDTADHAETVTKNVRVTATPIVIAAIPESGQLIPNLSNKVYIVTTYADGTPASCTVKWKVGSLDGGVGLQNQGRLNRGIGLQEQGRLNEGRGLKGVVRLDNKGEISDQGELDKTRAGGNPGNQDRQSQDESDRSGENKMQGEITTDQAGFGTIEMAPMSNQPVELVLEGQDKKGQAGTSRVTLETKVQGDDSILLRTDRSLYGVGDSMKLTIHSTRQTGTVYVDVIKDRQTCLTQTLELKDGQLEDQLTLDNTLAGTVQVNAWQIGKNGVIVRDRKLVLVEPADELEIKVASDNETYLPGTDAHITFRVTNKKGNGIASALGVMVVDEAVFALQEMQPGLEKVYFYLEKEIATPRYEIHGYDLDGCIAPPPGLIRPMKGVRQQRDTAAKVLLAGAKGVGDYSLHVNVCDEEVNIHQYQRILSMRLMDNYKKITQALEKAVKRYSSDETFTEQVDLNWLVKKGCLKKADTIDPWGHMLKMEVKWFQADKRLRFHDFKLLSAGIDGQWDTIDDVSFPAYYMYGQEKRWKGERMRGMGMGGGMMGGGMGGGMVFEVEGMPMPMAAKAMHDKKMDISEAEQPTSSAGEQPIRIRQYFPETLYFNPAVITDGRGRADLTIPLADSITTWRMTCMANSTGGLLGSTTAGIRVFQDFFVDIDFPVALTQNDQVHVPVAIYNYLKTDQTIELSVAMEDWFELEGVGKKTVTLGPGEVRAVTFSITAKRIGFQKFTVTARGTKKSDAVSRSVEIVPDGKEELISFSGRLDKDVTHTISIPETAIDDASTIFVKVYPGVLSQVVEGLDKMLRMPYGCFEQTSSSTYPNVLVLDYMKTTGKITPEIQMKAEGYINAGYQRLVSFEVKGGGFEWFGKAPAHRILTAYGLMEFYDMSKVHEVDPALIPRTQRWLADGQEKDGSWKPVKEGIHEGATNKFTDDVLRNTAYITWALASTEYKGTEVEKGVRYIKNHLDDMKDVYTRVLVANALSVIEPKGETTLDTLATLHEMRVEEGDTVHWKLDGETPTYGTGKAGDIEVTGLAIQAFIRCGRNLDTVSKAVTYLVKNKDAHGTWQSTQATIQALRAMLMAERGATPRTKATIDVVCNGETVKTLTVNEENSDVLQLVDLKEKTQKGDNTVGLKFTGEGGLMYQVVGRYYEHWVKGGPAGPEEPMAIRVDYDRTELAAQDVIGVTATVTNNRAGTAKMVIVDLGLPPGFTLMTDALDKLVEKQEIEKYSTTGRQIIVYLREVSHGKPVVIRYQLLAKYPLRAQTTKSTVYEYYNPQIRAEAKPIELVVEKD